MNEKNLDHLSPKDKKELMENIKKARDLMCKGTKIIISGPTGENSFENELNEKIKKFEDGGISTGLNED